MSRRKITADVIRSMKGRERIAALTAYDYPMTKLLDEAGVSLIHVGDTLGMISLGYPDTTLVTMGEMEHHVRAAARAEPRALLAADLPYESYETVEMAVANARRLVAAGAEAVKAEGGRGIINQVRAIIADGIPYFGHIGMLPQHIREEGAYRVKGKTPAEEEKLLDDAQALVEAGAFAIVLEIVTSSVAAAITRKIPIPTIGIGSGKACDGQILVTHDLVGMFPWFTPKFISPTLHAAEQMRSAIAEWRESI